MKMNMCVSVRCQSVLRDGKQGLEFVGSDGDSDSHAVQTQICRQAEASRSLSLCSQTEISGLTDNAPTITSSCVLNSTSQRQNPLPAVERQKPKPESAAASLSSQGFRGIRAWSAILQVLLRFSCFQQVRAFCSGFSSTPIQAHQAHPANQAGPGLTSEGTSRRLLPRSERGLARGFQSFFWSPDFGPLSLPAVAPGLVLAVILGCTLVISSSASLTCCETQQKLPQSMPSVSSCCAFHQGSHAFPNSADEPRTQAP